MLILFCLSTRMKQSLLSSQDYWQVAWPVKAYLDALMAFEPKADDPHTPYYDINKHRVKRLRKTIQLEPGTINELRHLFGAPSPFPPADQSTLREMILSNDENADPAATESDYRPKRIPGEAFSPAKKRYWLVINEFWCGDGAQITPVIEALTNASQGAIETRVVFRNEHPVLIDSFLTNGSRSVPKVIQMNAQFEVLGSWGPQPKTAQDLVVQLKSNPETASNYSELLHKWYADDHQRSTQKELIEFIASSL